MAINDLKTNCKNQPLSSTWNMQLTELVPQLPVGKSNNSLQMKKIHKEKNSVKRWNHTSWKVLWSILPNEKSVNYLGRQSAPDYNCQFEKISPTIKQNQITHLRKWSGDRPPPCSGLLQFVFSFSQIWKSYSLLLGWK